MSWRTAVSCRFREVDVNPAAAADERRYDHAHRRAWFRRPRLSGSALGGEPYVMNDSERAISEYLDSLRIGGVQYEPDGNVPPDFLVDGRIAVEARRLNEHEEVNGGYRGLEVTAMPLHAAVVKALDNSGPPVDSRSWFVHYTVRRPLPPWKEVERSLRLAVLEFRERSAEPPREMRLGRSIRLRFHPTSQTHPTLLLLGSSSDHDAGGFLVAELTRNLQICIPEKVQKIASLRQR